MLAPDAVLTGDDLLACVLGGDYTDVEKTMIELRRTTIVQETRNEFQNAMQDRFIQPVERVTERNVWRSSQTTTSAPTSKLSYFCSRRPRTQRRTLHDTSRRS
jgi:hypothetical protein